MRAIYEAARRVIPLVLVLLAPTAAAQWTLEVDGTAEPWPAGSELPADSASAARLAQGILHGRGYFAATVDSVVGSVAYARSGRTLMVESVEFSGLPGHWSRIADRAEADLVGHPLDGQRLSAAAMRLLEAMERDGRPGASVTVDRLETDSSGTGLRLGLRVDRGSPVVLQGIVVHGTSRTDPRLVEQLSGLEPGRRVDRFDATEIARTLDQSGLFASVLPPVLLATGDSTAIVQFVIEDAAPGAFDAALGYQPGTGGRSGSLVGTGRLALVNPFGGGRRFGVLIDRLPGQVSRAHIEASDPFFLSWPLEVGGSFTGLQQDSTFGKQSWQADMAVRLTRTVALTISGTRETASPGTAGTRVVAGRQLIPDTEGLFAGVGVRYRLLDRGVNPTRGLTLEMRIERGSYSRRETVVDTEGDTTRTSTRKRAERLTATGRAFIPVGARWVVVTGGDARFLVSDAYDRTSLFRLGGARSLRGYDEDRFEGRATGRVLAEIRRHLDLRTYAFVFSDMGFVDAPEGLGSGRGFQVKPGYGLGMQLDTAAGLVTATYGFNPEDGPANGRIHVAFSFGL